MADPAAAIIEAARAALTETFTGDGTTTKVPLVGNVAAVRFFAGDAPPMAAWDSHVTKGCDTPFVWVRAMRRYRSLEFPQPSINTKPCTADVTRVMPVELGVGWCAVTDQEPSWAEYDTEASTSLDVSRRLEVALCKAARALTLGPDNDGRLVGTDTIVPYGPEGGVIAWTTVLYASY